METISTKPALDPRILKQALDEIRAELRSRMGNKLSAPHHGDPVGQAAAHAASAGELPVDPAAHQEGMTAGQPNDEGEDPAPIISANTNQEGPTTQMIRAVDEKKKASAGGQSFYSSRLDAAAKRMLKAKV